MVTFEVSPPDAHIAQFVVATSLVGPNGNGNGNGNGASTTVLKALKVWCRWVSSGAALVCERVVLC